MLNAYTIAFACLLLSAGALGDRLGARRVFVSGFALFTLASVGYGFATGAAMLVMARVAQGVGAALCVPSPLSLLNASFPDPRARAEAVSIWAGTAALALGAGPIVGGGPVDCFGWPSIFLINVPFGVAGIWLTPAHAPDTVRDAARRFDLPGQMLAVVALAALMFGVVESGSLGWGSPAVRTGIACSVVFGLLFVLVEKRQRHPMLPLSLFQIPTINVSSAIGLSLNFGYYGLMFAMSLFFQSVRHYMPLDRRCDRGEPRVWRPHGTVRLPSSDGGRAGSGGGRLPVARTDRGQQQLPGDYGAIAGDRCRCRASGSVDQYCGSCEYRSAIRRYCFRRAEHGASNWRRTRSRCLRIARHRNGRQPGQRPARGRHDGWGFHGGGSVERPGAACQGVRRCDRCGCDRL
ncbi:MFS family permease [Paraburkholderia sp. 40]